MRATSSSARITATGVRSSWEASETRRRLVDVAVSSRPSMPFIVRASSAISSSDAGTGTRSCSECEPISATRDVTAWTGRNARPASSHASPATSATSTGPISHSRRRVASIVSRTASSGDAVARVTPPTDNAETSKASGSPWMPSSSALAIGTDPEYTTCCRPSSSVTVVLVLVRSVEAGRQDDHPPGPGRGQLERRPRLRGDGDGVGGDAPGEQLGGLLAQRRPVLAAEVADERSLERSQQTEGGDGEGHGEQPCGEQGDAQAHRTPAAPQPSADVHEERPVVDEAVADGPHRLQAVAGERPVDLRPQVADVDLDDVVVTVEVEAPHLGEQLGLRRRATVTPGESDEQLQLAGREDELAGAAPATTLVRIDAQVTDRQHAVDGVRGPADQCP